MKIAVGLVLIGVAVGFSLSDKQEREDIKTNGCVDKFTLVACDSMKNSGQCESIAEVRNDFCCQTCVPKENVLAVTARCTDKLPKVACYWKKRYGVCEYSDEIREDLCCQTCAGGKKRTSPLSKQDKELVGTITRYLGLEDEKK